MNEKQESQLNLNIEIDRLVHEPVRLKILAYLSFVESADFVFLVSRLGLTMGNLSAHISKLEKAGYIKVKKQFKENRPNTIVSMTQHGGMAFDKYKEEMIKMLSP